MEAKLCTNKRKQHSPADPFIGIFTRSKSRIYLHHNRSGRARLDANRKRHHHLKLDSSQESPRKRGALNKQHEASDIDDLSRISVKDLRARRVFSPASIVEDKRCSDEGIRDSYLEIDCKDKNSDRMGPDSNGTNADVENFDLSFCCASKNLNDRTLNLETITDHVFADKNDSNGESAGIREPAENGWNRKFGEGFSRRTKDLDVLNPNLSTTIGEIRACDVEHRGNTGRVDSSTEGFIQMTPNDTDISKDPKLDETRANVDIVNGSVSGNDDCRLAFHGSIDQKKDTFPAKKSVLDLRTRKKLFKTPSSFSYRRLLPFLMDIAKDDPCVSNIEKFGLGVTCNEQSLNGTKIKFSSMGSNICSPKDEDGGSYYGNKKTLENGERKNFGAELPHKAQKLNHSNPSEVEGNSHLPLVDQRSNEDVDLPNGVGELTEEHIQMTPGKVDIFSKPEVKDTKGNTDGNDWQTKDHILVKNPRAIHRNDNSTLKSKLILNPCSRRKVFKTPSSFSYRRLLPFLMDGRNDDSYHSSDVSKCTRRLKVENITVEKMQLPVSASFHQKNPMEFSNTDYSPRELHAGDSELSPPTTALTSSSGSSNAELKHEPSEKNIEPEMPFDSLMECISQVEQVISNEPRSLEPSPDCVSSDIETPHTSMLCLPANDENLHLDDALKLSHWASIASQEDSVVSHREQPKDTKSTEAVSLDPNKDQLESFIPSEISVGDLTKGILRRNTRGCRGVCNCLNCASFRLHADTAFEFSRNQMQDTERMALELIKELSELRNMLENSTTDAKDHAIVHVNQVNEACTKALKAEELAKHRLGQMNYDLSIHCNSKLLPRPRVRFSNNVEEVVIRKVD